MSFGKVDLEINLDKENVDQVIYQALQNKKAKYLITKRIIDMVGAFLGLIMLSPLFLLIIVLIKIEDPKASAIFKQRRVGINGKEFFIYKFRSMVSNAEELLTDNLLEQNEATGPLFKMKQDPRVTRVGKFIRRKSIDEFPQLWNVLKGEMSLVGPRPPLPEEVKQYSDYDRQRLLILPGCTGLWQVSGRSNIGFDEMVELDIRYIINRNLWLDMKIIIKTFFVVFTSDGAY